MTAVKMNPYNAGDYRLGDRTRDEEEYYYFLPSFINVTWTWSNP